MIEPLNGTKTIAMHRREHVAVIRAGERGILRAASDKEPGHAVKLIEELAVPPLLLR